MPIDIRTAMTDPKLFGGTFGGESFAAWRALLAGFYGLPLTVAEAEAFRGLTGRATLPDNAHDELWLVVGRRGGKSHVSALLALYEAVFRDHRKNLAPGERATVMLIAGDRSQARTLMRYVRGLVDSNPMIKAEVAQDTAEGVEFRNRSIIEVHTASHRAVRGYTCAAVICDEIAFWHHDGARPDAEVIAALRPSLATLGGKLIALSSPYARRGVLWENYRRHWEKPNPRILIAQAASRTLNPDLPERIVEDALKEDAPRASAEYLAQFRSDIEQFLTVELIDQSMRNEPMTLPYQRGEEYFAFVDPAGGGADEFTMAIGHRDGDFVVVDALRGQKGDPARITEAYVDVLKQYRIRKVYGDNYSGEWAKQEFRKHGIAYLKAPGSRSELYATLFAAMNAQRTELPPCDTLEKQLLGLERRVGRGGRDMIDHAPGGHDDRANAVAGLVSIGAVTEERRATTKSARVSGLI